MGHDTSRIAALSTPVTLAFNYSLPPASVCLLFSAFIFGNLTACILLVLHTMPMTTVYMTVDYMTVADIMLAPIDEKATTFVYSFHLCL